MLQSKSKYDQLCGNKHTLETAEELDIAEATHQLLKSNSPDSDIVEMMAFIKGKTLRGYTVASNMLKN